MFIAVDTETGGLDHMRHSLLSLAFAQFNHGNLNGALEWNIRPPFDTYNIDPGALRVNGIDLVKHFDNALPLGQALNGVTAFLKQLPAKPKPQLVGWNTEFDLRFIDEHLYSRKDLFVYFDYHVVDVSVLYGALQSVGIIPPGKCSLSSARKYFGITTEGEHSAASDAIATGQVYLRCLELLKGPTHVHMAGSV